MQPFSLRDRIMIHKRDNNAICQPTHTLALGLVQGLRDADRSFSTTKQNKPVLRAAMPVLSLCAKWYPYSQSTSRRRWSFIRLKASHG